jgi:hypothetical protein
MHSPKLPAFRTERRVTLAYTGRSGKPYPPRLLPTGVEAFRVVDRLSASDRAVLMGETLQRVYNWSCSKS